MRVKSRLFQITIACIAIVLFAGFSPQAQDPWVPLAGGDPATARKLWEESASHADSPPATQFNLAQLLRRGLGGESDPARAALLYFRASLRGFPPALHNYALMKAKGQGAFGVWDADARTLLERAAQAGFEPSRKALETWDTIQAAPDAEWPWIRGYFLPDGTPWTRPLELSPLRFTNRAQCALDSRGPATSLFLVIDGYAAGKTAHSLGRTWGKEPDEEARAGMRQFRQGLVRSALALATALLNRELPLLPARDALHAGEVEAEARSQLARWRGKASRPDGVSCYLLREFTPSLGAGILPGGPQSADELTRMAQDLLRQGETLTDCALIENEEDDARYSVIQLDLKPERTADRQWNRTGFRFWNSFLHYWSVAWRETPELAQLEPRFREAFRSLALEDQVVLVPNGCGSLTEPRCDGAHLGEQALRDFLAPAPSLPDALRALPRGPEKGLLDHSPREWQGPEDQGTVGQDTREWTRRFRERWVQARGDLRRREAVALERLRLMPLLWPGTKIEEALKERLEQAQADGGSARSGLSLLCTEWVYALHPQWGFLRADLERLASLTWNPSTRNLVKEASSLLQALAEPVVSTCLSMEEGPLWKGEPLPDPQELAADWYRDLQPAHDRRAGVRLQIDQSVDEALRAWLEAWVELRSVSFYREAVADSDRLSTPALFNPLRDATACRIYDPWFKQRAAIKNALIGFASAGLGLAAGTPALVMAETRPAQVTSLEKLVQDGQLQYRPRGTKETTDLSLWLAFAPASHLLCSMSLGGVPASTLPRNAVFNGIALSGCSEEERSTIQASGPENWTSTSRDNDRCLTCTLQFLSAAQAGPRFAPLLDPRAGVLLQDLARLYQDLRDPQDIPKVRSLDLDALRKAYLQWGKIPERCVQPLLRGLECPDEPFFPQYLSTFPLIHIST